jgi:hypothetical protein
MSGAAGKKHRYLASVGAKSGRNKKTRLDYHEKEEEVTKLYESCLTQSR